MLYAWMHILHQQGEERFWRTTPRTFFALLAQHVKQQKGKQRSKGKVTKPEDLAFVDEVWK